MGKSQTPPKEASPPLSAAEVTRMIEAAGYPFEIRMLERLRKAHLSPMFGPRFRVNNEGATKEIDILGRVRCGYANESASVTADILTFVQAKKIHDGAFVGFRVNDPDERTLDVLRMGLVGGLPSWKVLPPSRDPHSNLMIGLSDILRPLSAPVHCGQWTIVKRGQRSHQERGAFEDFAFLVRAMTCCAADITHERLRRPIEEVPAVDMHIFIGALVLDSPIFVFDPRKEGSESKPADSILVEVRIETDYGVVPAIIDVMTEAGLKAWFSRLKRAGGALQKRLLDGDAVKLGGFGRFQQQTFQRDLVPGT
jgi:hypothetical protein